MRLISMCFGHQHLIKTAAVEAAAERRDVEHEWYYLGKNLPAEASYILLELGLLSDPLPTADLHAVCHRRQAIEAILARKNNLGTVYVLYGDHEGTLEAARLAREYGHKTAHIEGGVRSFDSQMPEERRRREIDRYCDYLLTPEEGDCEHITNEALTGLPAWVGQIGTDILHLPQIDDMSRPLSTDSNTLFVSIHRTENIQDHQRLKRILRAISELAKNYQILILSRTPLCKAVAAAGASIDPRVRWIERMNYVENLRTIRESRCVITDSGGMDDEACILGKKSMIFRSSTERRCTLQPGTRELFDVLSDDLVDRMRALLENPVISMITPERWDGHAADRSIEHFLSNATCERKSF